MKKLIFAFVTVAFFMLGVVGTTAQTINGNITGSVVDQQKAAVPGATVTAKNTETGLERSVTTDSAGLFRISGLPVGNYSVRITGGGFAPRVRENVQVSVAQDTSLDFDLSPGSVEATVEVTSAGELLETTQSQVSKTVSEKQILELPGRNSLNGLALLNPGVLPNQNGRPGSGFAVNGNRTRSNNFTIDGANNNDQSLSIPRQNLPPDALQEFQIITNTFAAEFGRNAGSYVNQITKSGTNQFSGSAFWAWDGNKYNALTTSQERTFKANLASLGEEGALKSARSVQVDNIYGGTFGGPIVKNHTFFFTSLDFNPFRTTVSSASRTAISALGRQRLQYAGRGFNSQALSYLINNFPAANDPTSQGSLTLGGSAAIACPPTDPTSCNVIPFEVYNRGRDAGIPYGTDFKRWLMKINTRLFKTDQLSFRYLVDVSKDPGSPTSIPGQEVGQNLRNDSFTINDSMLLSARWLNEARFTYSRRDIQFPENLGIAFTVAGTGGALTLGNANFPQFRTDNVYEITDNVSFTPSNHAFKFGYNLLIYKLASFFAPNFNGSVSYPSLTNFLTDTSASYQQYAGDGLTDATTFEHSFFAQDDWRVTPDLTLNLGLRYEYVTTPFGFFSNAKPDINNFGPRLGFAWNPKNILGGHAVVRAGFAIAYDQVFQNVLLNNSRNYPRGVNLSFTNVNGALPFLNLPSPPPPSSFTGNPLLLPIRLFSPNERVKQPQSMQWTLGVQYELPAGWVFKADYIGTKGSNLIREIETNYGFCGAGNPLSRAGTSCSASAAVLAAQERIDPTRGSVLVGQGIAESIYHAGQFTVERRFSRVNFFGSNLGNMIMNANYTYSSYISESDDVLGGQTNRTLPADPRNPKLDRARSGFDQPHRFVMNIVWESPKVLNGAHGFFAKQIASRLLNGWLWSAVATYASGTPFSVLSANNALGITPGQVSTVEGSQRVSVNPSGQYPLVSTPTAPNPNAYFIVNPVSSGILGNLGANTERTGSTYNWNMALAKSFRTFSERQTLQLRVEAFNVFNHRNFTAIPANTIGNNVNTTTFLNLGFTNVAGRSFLFGAAYRF